jgi:hypothetical protein
MRRFIHWKAIAILALAYLFFFLSAVSFETMIGLIALAGLVSAVDGFTTYFRQPPSLTRFVRLNVHAGMAWFGFASAAVLALDELLPGLSPKTSDRVSNIGFAAIIVGSLGHSFWVRLAVRRAQRPRFINPDYAEDEAGNPLPNNEPPINPRT